MTNIISYILYMIMPLLVWFSHEHSTIINHILVWIVGFFYVIGGFSWAVFGKRIIHQYATLDVQVNWNVVLLAGASTLFIYYLCDHWVLFALKLINDSFLFSKVCTINAQPPKNDD